MLENLCLFSKIGKDTVDMFDTLETFNIGIYKAMGVLSTSND